MWFYPAGLPDYFFTCQECKHTQRLGGAEIHRVIWNFRACRNCGSTRLPLTTPVARSSGEAGVQIAESAPSFLLPMERDVATADGSHADTALGDGTADAATLQATQPG